MIVKVLNACLAERHSDRVKLLGTHFWTLEKIFIIFLL